MQNACNRDEHENATAADWNNIIIAPQVFQRSNDDDEISKLIGVNAATH
jgi:hypothetical protein